MAELDTVKLGIVRLGNVSVRFVQLQEDNLNMVMAPQNPRTGMGTGIPLFLACDVLCGCAYLPKNLTRIHARYAKDGMATKLKLQDFRVHGTCSSASLWFYTIRGLFQVIFEYQDITVQKDCLAKLKEVWLDKYDEDHALTPNMTVALDTRIFKPKVVDPQQRRNASHKVKEESTTGEPGNQAVTEDLVNETFDTDTSHKCCVCRGMGMFALNSSESDMNMEKYKTNSVGNGDQADKQSEDSGVGVTNMMKVRPTDRDAGKLCQQCDAMQCYSCNGSICGVFEREGNRLSKATQIETNTSNKATQIQTVPRISVKKSAGTQTDRDVMVFSERDHEKSETSETHKDSSQQTDINMNMFTVLTPNYSVHSTTSVGQSPKKGKTTSIGQSPKKGKRSRKKSRQTSFTPPKSDVIKEGTLVLESFIEYLRHRQESDPLDLVLSDSANICRVTLQLLSRELALPGGQGFPFHLIKDYLDQLKNPPAEMDNGDWGISWEYNVFLNTISRWLGQEFHQFESYIGKRLEKFKQDHIDCIDNLPPAETVIDQMFPKCMKELVFNWTNGESLGQPEFDHEYGSPQKKSRRCLEEETDMVYPIAQHILEFANHALVSGVAHVVYSRLRHTNY